MRNGDTKSRRSKVVSLLSAVLFALIAFWMAGCGGGGGGGGTPAPTVSLTPSSTSLAPQANQNFAITVSSGSVPAVTWSVQEGAPGGSITPAGLYTAPANAGTYHVVATGQANPSLSLTATVTVHVAVSVTPATPGLLINQTQDFTAAVAGTGNQAVSWSVREGLAGGSIDAASGHYIAPSVAGTYHVVATSQFDANQVGVATVVVKAGGISAIID
jgi:hypothetical protein